MCLLLARWPWNPCPCVGRVVFTVDYPVGFVTAACKCNRGSMDCPGCEIVDRKLLEQTLLSELQILGLKWSMCSSGVGSLCSHLGGRCSGGILIPHPYFCFISEHIEVFIYLIVARYTLYKTYILTIFSVQFGGINNIHIVVQPSPSSISGTFCLPKLKLCTHYTLTLHSLSRSPWQLPLLSVYGLDSSRGLRSVESYSTYLSFCY